MVEQHGKTLVPQIRFAGFTDPWEQRKLSELVEIERGGSPRPIERYITDDPCGLNWVKIGDAPELGRYITQTTEKIKPEGLAKTRQVYPGDLVLSNSMSFGRPYIMAIRGCIHDGWLLIRDAQKHFDPIFLCHMLGAPQMLNQYRMFAAGSTVNNLNKELVGKAIVSLPSKDEQREIGIVLDRLDSLITLHQRKYDKLCVLKKSMLDKMFPKGGSLYPEIRFAGFTDPWEQRKLGELCSFSKGCGYSKNDLRDQGTPIILYGRLYTNYETQIHSVDTFVKPLENSVYSEGGEVIIPASGETAEDISIASVVEKPGIILGGDLNVITSSADIDPVFLALELSYGKPHFDLAKRAQGKSVVHIHNEDIANVFFGHPNIAEQRRIGAFFDRLDSLITLHQRKLELLRNIKKSMLDKMFV
ncbi:restriction endonuclease subunit S [Bifidobacterium adolescentis]|uniref:restriction endonuclease subunit S n=1 Tax=Bifidobacterium adolescentis TaxID=1680 RepID=UPI000A19207B|nr:restriction endonuclease subunit S [Bifidobacterium adolescentis]